jgi:ubiquinone/menaquinone biosynthesis C-methylase UbiE
MDWFYSATNKKAIFLKMINRKLNYGRHIIENFLATARDFKTILDIGAGRGEDLSFAKNINSQAHLYAVEIYPEYARELARKDITVYSIDIEKDPLPFTDASVDIIIANQVLEHTKEIFWIFHEVTRVLGNRGNIIIGVPNLASFHNRMLLLFGKQPSPIKTCSAHIRGFTKEDIMKFLDDCFPGGYKLKKFGGSNFYPFPPLVAKPLSRIFPTMAWSIFMMLEKQRLYTREFLDFPISHQLETNFYLGDT